MDDPLVYVSAVLENTFAVGEIVKIKRTSGAWEDGEVVNVSSLGVTVKVKITDTFRGKPYDGPLKDGYKFIKSERFGTHLKKHKERLN